MSNRYLKPSPLPFENHDALSLFDEERPSFDVVESAPVAGLGVHADRVGPGARPRGFVAPTLFDVTGHDRGSEVNDDNDDNDDNGDDDIDAGDRDGEDNGDDHGAIMVNRQRILQRDHDDRALCRIDVERERDERRALRNTRAGLRHSRRAAARTGRLDLVGERFNLSVAHLRDRHHSSDESSGRRPKPELPTGDRGTRRDVADVATDTHHVRRVVAPLQGSALALYFVLLPYVVVTKWHRTQRQNDGALVRVLLVALALFWTVFLFQVIRDVWRLRRGASAGTGGSAWLAGVLVALLSFLVPSSAGAASLATTSPVTSVASTHTTSSASRPATPTGRVPTQWPSGVGAMPLALMAKRRSDLMRQQQFSDEDFDVEESIELLRSLNPSLLTQLRQMIGERRDGVLDVPNALDGSIDPREDVDAYVACALAPTPFGTLISFAREGGTLAIQPTWSSDDVVEATVALHHGKLAFAENEHELLRALATRAVRHTLVVYLGNRGDLDDELLACSITLTPYRNQPRVVATSSWTNVAPARHGGVRVELLRAEVHVAGLCEPLTPTLRRRGVEMLAYLAMHRHEPITGERLRTRVLTHADVDASLRTLANTASVVRRSAGADDGGPRLHAVTSSGLYVTHGITSDVEVFTTLIARARQLDNADAAPLAHQALAMVKGEPLASALRGFEWFLAEGFAARLSRDGEWAALALHHDALTNGRFEMAFWALQQGLLVDPYNDALLEASARVPRLRAFGNDRAQSSDESVAPGRAVAMSWSLGGFSNQVST
jgi:hypothetical protein